MKRLFSLLIFLSIILVAFLSLKPSGEYSAEDMKGLPWQIDILPDGRSNVFGVTLGQSTLGQARDQLGDDMELAVIAAAGQDTGGLEMYYGHYKAGFISGKLVLAARIAPDAVIRLAEHAVKSKYLENGARKFTVNPDDLPVALQAPVESMTFIPAVNIDEASALKRFGPADKTLHTNEQVTHLLYPDKGLDLIINGKGKDVLQYVAPGDFARLIEAPLQHQPNNASEENPSLSSISRKRFSASI